MSSRLTEPGKKAQSEAIGEILVNGLGFPGSPPTQGVSFLTRRTDHITNDLHIRKEQNTEQKERKPTFIELYRDSRADKIGRLRSATDAFYFIVLDTTSGVVDKIYSYLKNAKTRNETKRLIDASDQQKKDDFSIKDTFKRNISEGKSTLKTATIAITGYIVVRTKKFFDNLYEMEDRKWEMEDARRGKIVSKS